ncbi:hypothetical protein ACBP93_06405 [Paenalcaligenes hominis]|uniref:hypothetical protein n=1 Tax=Paenalcaligenes hominis TaxID=643674 RepID=UPI003523F1D7
MRKKVILLALVASLAGCAAPIMNVENAPVTSVSNHNLSASQVRDAIVRAGAGLGWQMKDVAPNLLQGTLHLRTHVAVVDIPYSAKEYSILYKSSVNLNAADGKIHKNYNGWITNLKNGINNQLAIY